MQQAVGRGHAGTVTALLAAPGLDKNATNGDGTTALALGLAESHGHVEIASPFSVRVPVDLSDLAVAQVSNM